ncbi:MAG: transglycosylase domain-containing protein [Endomicrobia bacterium]|nr:transglycosylase domain-containing protein [Endomicrobiia bacterium]
MKINKKILTVVLVFILIFISSLFFIYLINLYKELPAEDQLKDFIPVLSTKIFDRHNNLITELFTEKRTWIEFKDIPENIKAAVLAIEDHTFYQHWGINPKRIVKAMFDNIIKRRISAGGSTITQQLAKISFLTHRRSLRRKLKELILTFNLEYHFSKNEILEMYLNQVFFGHGAYGIQQAAKIYFSKNVSELTLSEAALLAGLVRLPSYYSPIKNYDRAIRRRNVVLHRMYILGYINKDQYEQAINENIIIGYTYIPSATAPYFVEYIKEQLDDMFSSEQLYTGGMSIITTLDLNLQRKAEQIINKSLEEIDSNIKSTEPVQCALVSIDVKTGQILTMIGGKEYKKSQFNRATQAKRQPGSAFKPIVFLAALENNYTPSTLIDDTPLVFYNNGYDWELLSTTTDYSQIDFQKLSKLKINSISEFISNLKELKEKNKIWIPENYNSKYYGTVTLRKALELSLNSCAIRIIMEVGPQKVIEYAKILGINSSLTPTYSLALGASEVTLIELITAYNVFANNGIKVEPYGILEIKDKFGNSIARFTPKESVVLNSQICYIVTNLLKGVIKRGTAIYAKKLGKTCAGKTGTTNDCTDAWFIGYTPDILCGIWVGLDIKKSLGKNATGGKIACPIWTEYMKYATSDKPDKDFEKPENIVEVLIDAKTGLLAGPSSKSVYLEAFIKGTEPTEFSEEIYEQPTQKEVEETEENFGF